MARTRGGKRKGGRYRRNASGRGGWGTAPDWTIDQTKKAR